MVLKLIPNLYDLLNTSESVGPVIPIVLMTHTGTQLGSILQDLGTDVNSVFANGDTLLAHMLLRGRNTRRYRETIEALIYENPDLERHTNVVGLGIDGDYRHVSDALNMSYEMDMDGRYTMDNQLHGLFGHDGTNYALNFLGPLFIESGFPFTRDELVQRLDKPLHPTEYEFLIKCLETPRSLKLRCRDVLRRHFKGRKLHTFTEVPYIPKTVKDFILLKHVLFTLNQLDTWTC